METVYCMTCKHYNGLQTCDAFKDKIPQDIFTGLRNHEEPVEGDNGITYEPIETSG